MRIKASFDDGTVEDLKVARLMKNFNIDTIFYWPVYPVYANNERPSLDDDQMSLIAKDFEIGSHTLTHPLLTRIPLDEAISEITESRKKLRLKFGQNIDSFCYPRGYANPEIEQAVALAGYTTARSTLVGYIHESENPYFEQTTVHVGCDRKEYGGRDWFSYAMVLLEEAKRTPDSVFSIFGHSWEIEKTKSWAKLKKLLEEATK